MLFKFKENNKHQIKIGSKEESVAISYATQKPMQNTFSEKPFGGRVRP